MIHSGKKVQAPGKPGSENNPPIENAPGSYVYEKCGELPYF